jgi:zinc protease
MSTPLTAEELANAKSFLTGYYLLDVGTPATFANLLATNYLLGLPWDAVNEYVSNIETVTVKEVQAAAQHYMEAKQPIIVIVGDAKVIEPQLEGLGEVLVVDVHGEPVE